MLPVDEAPLPPTVTIDARRWPHVQWKTMLGAGGMLNVGRADLRALPPGNYNAEVALCGRNLGGFVLQKL
jgi:hypothetical protein